MRCYRRLLLNRNEPHLYTDQSNTTFSYPTALSLPSYLFLGLSSDLFMPGLLTKLVYVFLTSPYMICTVHVIQIILYRMYKLWCFLLCNFSIFISNGLSIHTRSVHSSVLKRSQSVFFHKTGMPRLTPIETTCEILVLNISMSDPQEIGTCKILKWMLAIRIAHSVYQPCHIPNNRRTRSNLGKWPTWRTTFYAVRLFQSSACFKQPRAHHQEVKLY